MRDSNPRPKFGRLGCYLYTNYAKWWMGWGSNPPLPGSRPTLGLQPSALSIEASHPDAACVAHGANVIITIAQGFSGTKNKLTACCHYTLGGSWYPEGLPTVEGFEPSLPSYMKFLVDCLELPPQLVAGCRGLEPRLSILETPVLPLHQRPTVNCASCQRLRCTCSESSHPAQGVITQSMTIEARERIIVKAAIEACRNMANQL